MKLSVKVILIIMNIGSIFGFAAEPTYKGDYLGQVRFLGGKENEILSKEELRSLNAIDQFVGSYSWLGAAVPDRLNLFVYRDPQSSAFFDQANTVYFPFQFLRIVQEKPIVFDRSISLGVALHEVGHSLSMVGWREYSSLAIALYDKRSKGIPFTSRELNAFNWMVGIEEWFSDIVGWMATDIELNDLAKVFMANSRRFDCSKTVDEIKNDQVESVDEPHGYFASTRCLFGDLVKKGKVSRDLSYLLKIERGLENYFEMAMAQALEKDKLSVEDQNLELETNLIKWLK